MYIWRQSIINFSIILSVVGHLPVTYPLRALVTHEEITSGFNKTSPFPGQQHVFLRQFIISTPPVLFFLLCTFPVGLLPSPYSSPLRCPLQCFSRCFGPVLVCGQSFPSSPLYFLTQSALLSNSKAPFHLHGKMKVLLLQCSYIKE